MTKNRIIILLIIALSGCTTLKTLEVDYRNDNLTRNINTGDELVIQTKDLSSYKIMVDKVEPRKITGRKITGDRAEKYGQTLTIEASDISYVTMKKFSVWKTLGLLYGINSVIVSVILYKLFSLNLEIGG